MILTSDQVSKIAEELFEAEQSLTQIPLISKRFPETTLEDAYAVQDQLVQMKIKSGLRQIGWKIGFTSYAMQAALQIDIPDSGILFDNMQFFDGAVIPKKRFIKPRVEAEIAFVLRAPLKGSDISIPDVINATDYILPALEILDTRVVRKDQETGTLRNVIDTISDNAANAGIVTGGRLMRPLDVDLRWAGAIVSKNGSVVETGLGAGVLNHPATGIVWLVKRLSMFDAGLEPGQIILSGSFIRPIETDHGDTVISDFGPLGTISVYFE
jgi:2-oxo-hept-3-ene-1,7-dioate hydratase